MARPRADSAASTVEGRESRAADAKATLVFDRLVEKFELPRDEARAAVADIVDVGEGGGGAVAIGGRLDAPKSSSLRHVLAARRRQ